jgi:hypothetical protein
MEYAIGADPEFLRVLMRGATPTSRRPRFAPRCSPRASGSSAAHPDRARSEISALAREPAALIDALPKIGFTAEHSIALVHRTPSRRWRIRTSTCSRRGASLPYVNFRDVEQAKDWLRTR